MISLFHSTKNAQRSTFNAQRSSIFDFGVRRSFSTPNSSFLTPNSPARTRAAAFTLVETALALLAISLGLLGIFGLARHGLKNGGDTENETRCTLLADTVFESLKAKNNELIAKKTSLEGWWLYWIRFASSDAQVPVFLPPMPEISANNEAIRIALGTHELDDYLSQSATLSEIKWNPTYSLVLAPNGIDQNLSSESISDIYQSILEHGQIDVTFRIHPGKFQSGAEWRTFYTTLTYTGGLP